MDSDNQRKATRQIRRRAFIGRVAKKAAYVAPAVLALQAASKAKAGVSGCGQTGSPCTIAADCCGGFFCLQTMGMGMGDPCSGQDSCECE